MWRIWNFVCTDGPFLVMLLVMLLSTYIIQSLTILCYNIIRSQKIFIEQYMMLAADSNHSPPMDYVKLESNVIDINRFDTFYFNLFSTKLKFVI